MSVENFFLVLFISILVILFAKRKTAKRRVMKGKKNSLKNRAQQLIQNNKN